MQLMLLIHVAGLAITVHIHYYEYFNRDLSNLNKQLRVTIISLPKYQHKHFVPVAPQGGGGGVVH